MKILISFNLNSLHSHNGSNRQAKFKVPISFIEMHIILILKKTKIDVYSACLLQNYNSLRSNKGSEVQAMYSNS